MNIKIVLIIIAPCILFLTFCFIITFFGVLGCSFIAYQHYLAWKEDKDDQDDQEPDLEKN